MITRNFTAPRLSETQTHLPAIFTASGFHSPETCAMLVNRRRRTRAPLGGAFGQARRPVKPTATPLYTGVYARVVPQFVPFGRESCELEHILGQVGRIAAATRANTHPFSFCLINGHGARTSGPCRRCIRKNASAASSSEPVRQLEDSDLGACVIGREIIPRSPG